MKDIAFVSVAIGYDDANPITVGLNREGSYRNPGEISLGFAGFKVEPYAVKWAADVTVTQSPLVQRCVLVGASVFDCVVGTAAVAEQYIYAVEDLDSGEIQRGKLVIIK